MADTELDLCPRERELRVCASILEAEERAIADACESALFSLAAPEHYDLDGVEFYPYRAYQDEARRQELTTRAARAALAVLFADDGMDLPDYIDIAYDMPEPPALELQRLIAEQRKLNASLAAFVAEAEEAQRRPAANRLIDLAQQAQLEIHNARRVGEPLSDAIRKLADDLNAVLAEAAA